MSTLIVGMIVTVMTIALYYVSKRLIKTFLMLIYKQPTKISDLTKGYVRIKGNVSNIKNQTLLSPVFQKKCIWFRVTLAPHTSDEKNTFEHVHTIESDIPLVVRDASGECLLSTDKALVITSEKEEYRGFSKVRIQLPQEQIEFRNSLLAKIKEDVAENAKEDNTRFLKFLTWLATKSANFKMNENTNLESYSSFRYRISEMRLEENVMIDAFGACEKIELRQVSSLEDIFMLNRLSPEEGLMQYLKLQLDFFSPGSTEKYSYIISDINCNEELIVSSVSKLQLLFEYSKRIGAYCLVPVLAMSLFLYIFFNS